MRIIFQFLLIALFWFSGFAPAAATPQKPVDLHKEGIEIHHDSAIEHYKRGVAFADSGRYQKAVSEFKEVLKISPQGPKGHIILGLAYGKLGRNEDEISIYKKALRTNPEDPDVHYFLGSVHGKMGNYKEAAAEFMKAIQINPGDSDAHYLLGCIYNIIQDGVHAILYTKKAEQLYLKKKDNSGIEGARKNLSEYYGKYGYSPEDFAYLNGSQSSTLSFLQNSSR